MVMNVSVGIVGLPNAGKSTLFNALLGRQIAQTASHPFTTIEPNIGVVAVPDPKLEKLVQLIKPKRAVPATIKFIDIAGLIKNAYQGEGLGNQFLSQIRSTDAILHIVRAFSNPSVSRVETETDSQKQAEIVNLELAMSDLEIVKRQLEEAKKKARTNPETAKLAKILEKIFKTLNEGKTEHLLTGEEKLLLKDFNFLTLKPVIYVLNVDENGPAENQKLPDQFQAIEVSALLESNLAELSPEERNQYLQEYGKKEVGLDRVIQKAYQVLNLVTFYTVKGGQEVTAWPIPKGSTALQAAGQVHTDMAKGFVKAQVINVDKLLAAGSWVEAGKRGLLRLEGKDYLVQDEDVSEFKFSK